MKNNNKWFYLVRGEYFKVLDNLQLDKLVNGEMHVAGLPVMIFSNNGTGINMRGARITSRVVTDYLNKTLKDSIN